MGRYVDEILQPGEQLRYSTTIHGIVYAPGLVCLALAAAALIGAWTTLEGTLVAVRFKGRDFTRPLAILHRKGRVLTPAMKKFVETLGLDLPGTRKE